MVHKNYLRNDGSNSEKGVNPPSTSHLNFKEMLEQDKGEDEALLKQEKKPEDLIAPIEGYVSHVSNENYSTSVSRFNGVIGPGGHTSVQGTGNSSRLEIILEGSEVKTLTFYGASAVRGGDLIRAYVVKGEKKKLHNPIGRGTKFSRYYPGQSEVLVEGPFQKSMEALYLEIINEGKVVRTDYSIKYDNKEKKLAQ